MFHHRHRRQCLQLLLRHSDLEHDICLARPIDPAARPLGLYCSFGSCQPVFNDNTRSWSISKMQWDELHTPVKVQPSFEQPEHASLAAAIRSCFGLNVRVKHGLETVSGQIVDDLQADSLHMVR